MCCYKNVIHHNLRKSYFVVAVVVVVVVVAGAVAGAVGLVVAG